MKRLLFVGDAGCPSGFARATHEILNVLQHHFDVTVLGINFRGDPTGYPEFLRGRIWAAAAEPSPEGYFSHGGEYRLTWMCDHIQPDIIVIQNDGWNIPGYLKQLVRFNEHALIPVVASLAVDGENFNGRWLDGVSYAVFWTQFALREARKGGFDGHATVIPLGVDTTTFYPEDRREARVRKFGNARPNNQDVGDIFIIGNVNRNQPRKRWDLTIRYFAEWKRQHRIEDAYLYLHAAPTGDTGVDVRQLARYYGVAEWMVLREPRVWYGVPEQELRDTYNCFDVQISTTQGEGFGLTTFEGMACGIPQIVPAWASLGEICKDAACLVPCTSTAIGPPYVNVIGGVADEDEFVRVLHDLYTHPELREKYSTAGLRRVEEPRYQWKHIGAEWVQVLDEVLAGPKFKLAERQAVAG